MNHHDHRVLQVFRDGEQHRPDDLKKPLRMSYNRIFTCMIRLAKRGYIYRVWDDIYTAHSATKFD